MSNVTSELIGLIEGLSIGLEAGVSLFSTSDTPSKPDRITIVRVDGTAQPDMPSIDYQRIAFKVICRDSAGKAQRCEKLVDYIRVSFREVGSVDVMFSKFVSVDHVFGPVDMGTDGNNRPIYRADFIVNRTGSVEEFSYGYPSNSR